MGTRGSVRWLTALLGLATVFVVVFNVVPAVRSWDSTGLLESMPFVGPQQSPTVVVREGAGFRARVEVADECDVGWRCEFGMPELFPWIDTSDGTNDARTGLPPVSMVLGYPMRLSFLSLPWWQNLAFTLPPLALAALALGVIWSLWQIVRTLRTGEVFTRANVRRVMLVGVLVGAGSMLLQVGQYLAQQGVLAASAAAGIVEVAPSFNLLPLWLGAVVLLLAEVFRQGVRLRTEVEGLV